jgi:2-polyprenyl-6-hydroxyphenyl methylase/3-demethylubiquinone-9 3-methyltransferase
MSEISEELLSGRRFAFGKNWSRFLAVVDQERIAAAEMSLRGLLEVEDLAGKSFLDVGSGSGLLSLAARRIGAQVHSVDVDSDSVACTSELKRRYFPDDTGWTVEQGSILDDDYLETLSEYDVVYAWGVLHHTGEMWRAIKNCTRLVKRRGTLAIAIYNDQGGVTRRWAVLKRLYNRSPRAVRILMVLGVGLWLETRAAGGRLLRLQNPLPFGVWSEKKRTRGMSVWHDLVDWVGGYPFEAARPEDVLHFVKAEGFVLTSLKTKRGHGNNQYVFERTGDSS